MTRRTHDRGVLVSEIWKTFLCLVCLRYVSLFETLIGLRLGSPTFQVLESSLSLFFEICQASCTPRVCLFLATAYGWRAMQFYLPFYHRMPFSPWGYVPFHSKTLAICCAQRWKMGFKAFLASRLVGNLFDRVLRRHGGPFIWIHAVHSLCTHLRTHLLLWLSSAQNCQKLASPTQSHTMLVSHFYFSIYSQHKRFITFSCLSTTKSVSCVGCLLKLLEHLIAFDLFLSLGRSSWLGFQSLFSN